MSNETFLLFLAYLLFSCFNAFMNLRSTSNALIRGQSYFLVGFGLGGMLYLLIKSIL